jgi:hypothetical protein
MTTVPGVPPVTIPVPEPTVAIVVLLLLQVPLADALLKVIFKPAQTVDAPDIVPGGAITVIVLVASVPQPVEYLITTVPAIPPVTIPDPEPTVAILVLLVFHVPPAILLLNVRFDPEHTIDAPDIAPGATLVVTVVVASVPQPVE